MDMSRKFLTWEEITQWASLKERSPTVQKIVLGKTYENRELFVLKLSTGKKVPSVFVMGGEEGRDWLSSGLLLNMVDDILRNVTGLHNLLNYYNVYILPVFNPDGYEYSKQYDRFWSKNRKVFFSDKMCYYNNTPIGVNIDRNWYFSADSLQFGDNVCDPVYIGDKSLSEAEPQAVSEFLNSIAPHLMAFINIKGFDRLILVPYANNSDHTSNYAILMEILESTCEKLQQDFNTTFFYGNTASLLYNATGNSADWVKKNLNVPIVYTVYLKFGNHLIPHPYDQIPLKQQFALILQKTLMLAHDIYHPLFNEQTVRTSTPMLIVTIFFAITYSNNTFD